MDPVGDAGSPDRDYAPNGNTGACHADSDAIRHTARPHHAYPVSHRDADGNGNAYAERYAHVYADCHADIHQHTDADRHPDTNCHADSFADPTAVSVGNNA
jgi:hypothetical protein